MFISKNKVRMHDTDMAGILYFPRQFRFVHDALEDMMESEGLAFDHLFKRESFVFVIVHAESDYLAPLYVGDNLEVHVKTDRIGTSSFAIAYEIYRIGKPLTLVGTAKTVHVSLSNPARTKIFLPDQVINILERHLKNDA